MLVYLSVHFRHITMKFGALWTNSIANDSDAVTFSITHQITIVLIINPYMQNYSDVTE